MRDKLGQNKLAVTYSCSWVYETLGKILETEFNVQSEGKTAKGKWGKKNITQGLHLLPSTSL